MNDRKTKKGKERIDFPQMVQVTVSHNDVPEGATIRVEREEPHDIYVGIWIERSLPVTIDKYLSIKKE